MLNHKGSEPVPTVSVIVPCYDQGQYIDEAVDSVLKQTFQSFEIIVINDGSTDKLTIERLKDFDKPKTRVIHTNNQGVSAARNRGIQEARGKYILPLDADDCITQAYLEQAVQVLNHQPEVGIVYGQAELFGERSGFWHLPDYQFPNILLENVIFNSALFHKTDWELVGGYRSNMVAGLEDYDFWLYLIELGRKIVRLPEVVYLYRQRPNSRNSSIQFEQIVECYTQIFHNHIKLYTKNVDTLFRAYLTCQNREHRHIAELAVVREKLHHTQAELQTTQAHLRQSQAELEINQTQLCQSQAEAEAAQMMIVAMESSKFWKIRKVWLSFKKMFFL